MRDKNKPGSSCYPSTFFRDLQIKNQNIVGRIPEILGNVFRGTVERGAWLRKRASRGMFRGLSEGIAPRGTVGPTAVFRWSPLASSAVSTASKPPACFPFTSQFLCTDTLNTHRTSVQGGPVNADLLFSPGTASRRLAEVRAKTFILASVRKHPMAAALPLSGSLRSRLAVPPPTEVGSSLLERVRFVLASASPGQQSGEGRLQE